MVKRTASVSTFTPSHNHNPNPVTDHKRPPGWVKLYPTQACAPQLRKLHQSLGLHTTDASKYRQLPRALSRSVQQSGKLIVEAHLESDQQQNLIISRLEGRRLPTLA